MKFRLQSPEPGEAGGGPIDRGDNFDPDAESAAAALEAAAAEAAKAVELEKELEPEPEAEAEPEKEPKAKDTRIPLARHKEILEKEREQRAALERTLAQYQQGQQLADVNVEITALENSVLKLEKDYAKLLTDGEVEQAAAVMAQIRKAERDMAESKSDMKIQAAEIRAAERTRYGVALERIENSFPVLNPDHDSYDEALMGEVAELKDAYQMKGHTPTVALQKAVRALVELRTTKQELATTVAPRVDAAAVAADRKKAAVTRAAAAVAKTPPSTELAGVDSDKLGGGKLDAAAVIKLSQTEFNKLSEADLALMRGDTV